MTKKPAKPVKSRVEPVDDSPSQHVMPRREADPFRKLLLAKQRILSGDISHMEDESLKRGRQENAAQDISNFAELGTDNFEQEFTIGLIENEEEAMKEIGDALDRIKAGRYGACETCGKRVSKERLRIVPYTRHCIACQQKEERAPG